MLVSRQGDEASDPKNREHRASADAVPAVYRKIHLMLESPNGMALPLYGNKIVGSTPTSSSMPSSQLSVC